MADAGFRALLGADDWFAAVSGWIRGEARRVGFDDWHFAPEVSQRRERAARLLSRASDRVSGELSRVPEADFDAAVSRLHDHRRERDRSRISRVGS